MPVKSHDTQPHPLDCPRCGCSESRVLDTRRMDSKRNPQPLPALRRRRQCVNCDRQFRTKETIEEVDLSSAVWKVTTDGRQIVEASVIPHGRHPGEWTAYEVTVKIGGEQYVLHTRNDMRSEGYPCVAIAGRDGIRVESVVS